MRSDASVVGRRIVIYGVTGSGKSTLARRLGEALDLPVIELDALRHDGGWDTTSWDVMRERLAAAIASSPTGWVCEGNYRHVRDVALAEADTVIWLRLPWLLSWGRLLRRTIARGLSGAPLYAPHGPRDSLRVAFFSRRSILWWGIHHHRATQRSISEAIAGLRHEPRVLVLRSRREVADLVYAATRPRARPRLS